MRRSLKGGDDSCHCDDFSEPMSREEKKGWLQSHHANVEKIDLSRQYDVVFYGDEMMQSWTGKWLNMPMITPDGARIARIWNQTFTKAGGGDFEGLALGIMGDVVS